MTGITTVRSESKLQSSYRCSICSFFMTGNAGDCQMSTLQEKLGLIMGFDGKSGRGKTIDCVALLAGAFLCPVGKLPAVVVLMTIHAVAEFEAG